MPDKIYEGAEAEVVAVQHGFYQELLARVAGQRPMHKGNLLSRVAIGEGVFVALTKSYDGALVWRAIVGPNAQQCGLKFGLAMWDKHKGSKERRGVSIANYAPCKPS